MVDTNKSETTLPKIIRLNREILEALKDKLEEIPSTSGGWYEWKNR